MEIIAELFNLSFIVELIGLFFSIFLLRSAKDHWFFFIWYMVVVIVVEIVGWLLRMSRVPNHLLYNFFLIISTVFYLFIIREEAVKGLTKKIYLVASYVFMLFAFVNLVFGQGVLIFNGFTHLFASGLMIMTAIIFYSNVLKLENDEDLSLKGGFWFVNGLFLFHIGIIFLTVFQDTLINIYKSTGFNYYRFIIQFINVLFYACLIVSFYLKSKTIRKEVSTAQE